MSGVPSPALAGSYMASHSRSFRFATLLLDRRNRGRIERVYAWCRHTDNLVDAPSLSARGSAESIDASLDEWMARSRESWQGIQSGMPLLDAVMTDLRESGGSFAYPEAIIRGVRSDLRFRPFQTFADLRTYTHDVASVVGLWLCSLNGVTEPWMLERAAALGHAMQLTNIIRDVGEDLKAGRVYIPIELLNSRGLTMVDLYAMRGGRRPVAGAYRSLIEDLMDRADADYALAREAIPALPPDFGRAVAVAADIYAAIHDGVRANGYDNFTRRARTTGWQKAAIAARACWRLRASRPDAWGHGPDMKPVLRLVRAAPVRKESSFRQAARTASRTAP